MNEVSAAEKLLRLRGDLTQAEMAEKIGVSVRFYSNLELGKQEPGFQTLKKIHAAFGFPEPLERPTYKETPREKALSEILAMLPLAPEGALNTILQVLQKELPAAKAKAKREG
jgi:transcriptional regulator with XRE-family HTH domain